MHVVCYRAHMIMDEVLEGFPGESGSTGVRFRGSRSLDLESLNLTTEHCYA